MNRSRLATVVLAAAVAGSITIAAQHAPGGRTPARPLRPVTDEMLLKPDPADWLMWRRTLDSHGFSPLNQITRNNVGRMKMMWTRGMGPGNVQEATPLVHDGVMFLPSPSDMTQAIDAKTGQINLGSPVLSQRRSR